MAHMLGIIFHGLIIGILISAPMGPIGMLCIQRTLTKGRLPGLFTGMGAALSDLIYCLLTGLGLSFVIDFIEANQLVLQIFGSLVLLGYALFLFRSNPARALMASNDRQTLTPWRDFVTGFIFTFSNPLILFIIIGLFARFNFMDTTQKFYHYIAGYVSIAGGALLWWTFITFAINKVRSRFNLRSMRLVNRIIAIVLAIMALVGIVTGTIDLLS